MTAYLARFGGVFLHPRPTLLAILRSGDGSMWHVAPAVIVVCMAASPVEAGRALLTMRVDLLAGFSQFMAMIGYRMGNGLIGAVVAAALLYLLNPRKGEEGISFDRAIDCAFFMLIPFLVMMSLGVLLSRFGVELWFMPHRRLRGIWWVFGLRVLVAYGWSIVLFLLVAWSVWRSREPNR